MEWVLWGVGFCAIVLILWTAGLAIVATKHRDHIEAKLDKVIDADRLSAKTLTRIQMDLREILEDKDE